VLFHILDILSLNFPTDAKVSLYRYLKKYTLKGMVKYGTSIGS
jgi:hypothetical protein